MKSGEESAVRNIFSIGLRTAKFFVVGLMIVVLWVVSIRVNHLVKERKGLVEEVQKSALNGGTTPHWFYQGNLDDYRLIERSTKYAILFIAVTFLSFFLFELITKIKIHPFQYLLSGAALIIFYLLLLSLSEHVGFAPSYLVASLMIIALVTAYVKTILKVPKRTALMTTILSVSYFYLYITLQLEYYALLSGSLLLFIALALVMYLTRGVNWYKLE